MSVSKNINEKTEDFVGWRSDDGLLEVVELLEKSKHSKFKVICHKCKEDTELFPQGYFICYKHNLKRGVKPCGCSYSPRWSKEQFLVLANRSAHGRFLIKGFAEEFHGQNTKIQCECIFDGYQWQQSINNLINNKKGCPKCKARSTGDRCRSLETKVLEACKNICLSHEYTFVGFPKGYKNNQSRFEYICPVHGKQNVCYNNFVNCGSRCGDCHKERLREESNLNGYYPKRRGDSDFLYVLDFNGQFIKVGRSFNVEGRMEDLRTAAKISIKKIYKLRIFTATHQEIYDTEQDILEELRERGFQYRLKWTNEAFENDCLFILNKLLDSSGLQEIL